MPFARVTIQPGERRGSQFAPKGEAIRLDRAEIDASRGLAVKMPATTSGRLETGELAEVEYQEPNTPASKAVCEIGIEQGSEDGWVYRSFTAR